MKKMTITPEKGGFKGAYFPAEGAESGIISLFCDAPDDLTGRASAKYFHGLGLNVLCVGPETKDCMYRGVPLETFGRAVRYLRSQGNRRVGIAGISRTAMAALTAASYYPEITLTVALAPCDLVMEGVIQDGKDGARERPARESAFTWGGEQVPYLRYAFDHPAYWQNALRYAQKTGNRVASRSIFDSSEKRYPIEGPEFIKVEDIKGRIFLAGAQDDVIWDTCRYIDRMKTRLEGSGSDAVLECAVYEHGTNFLYPQRMMDYMFPKAGELMGRFCFSAAKEYPQECLAARKDIDRRLGAVIAAW